MTAVDTGRTLGARHLTAMRLMVLDILAESGPSTPQRIVDEWAARRPDMGVRRRQELPEAVGQLLWRLTNLEWAQREGEEYLLTPDGARMRTDAARAG